MDDTAFIPPYQCCKKVIILLNSYILSIKEMYVRVYLHVTKGVCLGIPPGSIGTMQNQSVRSRNSYNYCAAIAG